MTESPDPNGPVEIRASDADRERVAERLREAAADGRITMDELDQRLETAYNSMTHAELRPLTPRASAVTRRWHVWHPSRRSTQP